MQRLARLVATGFLALATGCTLFDMCGPEDRRLAIGGDVLDSAQMPVGSVGISLLQMQLSTQSSLAVSFWSLKQHEPNTLTNHVLSARLLRADSVVLELPPTLFSSADNYMPLPGATSDTADSLWAAFQFTGLRVVLTTDVTGMESLSIPLHLAVLENWHKHPCD